jgi:hypothetical protein
MLKEGTMTAHRPAKPSPARALARKQDLDRPPNKWDALIHAINVIEYAIEDPARARRLSMIVGTVVAVVGAVLAALLILRFWA